MKHFVCDVLDAVRYDWNVKAALVYTLGYVLLIISLYIPISLIVSVIPNNISGNMSRNEEIMIIGYCIYAISMIIIKWKRVAIFNWILKCMYQRTKWDGTF